MTGNEITTITINVPDPNVGISTRYSLMEYNLSNMGKDFHIEVLETLLKRWQNQTEK